MAPICTPRFPMAQIFYSLFASLSNFSSGMCVAWAVQTVLNTQSRTWSWSVWPQEVPWILATQELGALMATVPVGYAVDKYGRKYVLVSTGFMFLLCWLIVLAADRTPENLYSARVVAGLGVGASAITVPIYVAEITEAHVRGFLLTISRAMFFAGLGTMHAIGPHTSYGTLVGVCSLSPLLFLVTFCWSPESPHVLVMQEKWNKATENLQSLRGTMECVKDELDELTAREDERTRIAWSQLVRAPALRTSGLLSLCFTLLGGLSGFGAIHAYSALQLLPSQDPAFLSAGNYLLTSTWVICGSCVLSAFFMDLVGRRVMMMISSAVCTLSMVATGYFYLKARDCSDKRDSCELGWWVLSALIVWAFGYGLGLCSIPITITAELTQTNARGITTAIVTALSVVASFFVTEMFETTMLSGMGLHAIYWSFAAASFVAFGMAFLLMPETKGKKLGDIQKEMHERYGAPSFVQEVPEVQQNGREMAPIRQNHQKEEI